MIYFSKQYIPYLVTNIDDEGGKLIGEALTINKTINFIDLRGLFASDKTKIKLIFLKNSQKIILKQMVVNKLLKLYQ